MRSASSPAGDRRARVHGPNLGTGREGLVDGRDHRCAVGLDILDQLIEATRGLWALEVLMGLYRHGLAIRCDALTTAPSRKPKVQSAPMHWRPWMAQWRLPSHDVDMQTGALPQPVDDLARVSRPFPGKGPSLGHDQIGLQQSAVCRTLCPGGACRGRLRRLVSDRRRLGVLPCLLKHGRFCHGLRALALAGRTSTGHALPNGSVHGRARRAALTPALLVAVHPGCVDRWHLAHRGRCG